MPKQLLCYLCFKKIEAQLKSDFDKQTRNLAENGVITGMSRRLIEKHCKALKKMEDEELARLKEKYKIGQ